jgi:integrase
MFLANIADKVYMRLLTYGDLSKILNVNNTAITELVNNGKIPYKRVEDTVRFCPEAIGKWLREKPVLKMDNDKYIERFRKRYLEKVPDVMAAIEEYGKQFSDPHKPKYYYLSRIKNKKHGFLYYVKYLHNGKVVPSRWNTHTNDYEAAERFAVQNRDKILAAYFEKKESRKQCNLYKIFKTYYGENSPYLIIDSKRGRVLNEDARRTYHNVIIKQFIPYLRRNKIKDIEEIDTPFLARFQNYLLSDKKQNGKTIPGIKPQTINHYISYISQIFDHLLVEGYTKINPCKSLITLKIKDEKITGCYEINKLKGVFNKKWESEYSYLLCLIIYTTGMRNGEIERIKLSDITTIDDYRFINISESKTKNGIRIVPLHNFVYERLRRYTNKVKKGNEDFVFSLPGRKTLGSNIFDAANSALAKHTGYSDERLAKENLTFYSGRHFWKTLMDSENLGDIEEYFMGHKTSADVAKRYNHKDKQGKKKLLERTKKVFQILDKHIFI